MDSAKLSKIMRALSNRARLELYLQIAKQSEANFDEIVNSHISGRLCKKFAGKARKF